MSWKLLLLSLLLLAPVARASGISAPPSYVNLEVTANNAVTTTSTSFVLLPGMTLTPPAGTYIAVFSFWVSYSAWSQGISGSLYLGGSLVPGTTRTARQGTNTFIGQNFSNSLFVVSGQDIITVDGTSALEVRWLTTTGTGTANDRTLTLVRLQ